MAKTLGLDIVIGSVVVGALNGFKSVISESNKLGSTIEKLNQKKLTILENTYEVKKFTDRIATLDKTLEYLYKKKKELQIKKSLAKSTEEAEKVNNELKKINKEISLLNGQKFRLKDELEKAKEKALQTNRELQRVGSTIEKLNKLKLKLKSSELKREEFKSKLFDTVAIGITASFPIKKAIEFESAMADVVKVANLNKTETLKMSKALEKLSTQIPISADGLAAIAASGASLGIAKDKLIDFTKVVAKMSTAFDMSAEEAGEAVAKIMNVYGLGLKEASKLGDVLNYLSDNTAAKARDMINVLSRIGGTAKMFGLSAKNAAALADAFLAMGKAPEVAATAINALLTKLNTADQQGKQFQEGLKALGLTSIDIKFAIKNNPQKAIMMVLNRIKQFDKQTQMSILTKMFGAEYSDDIALLVAGLDNYKNALKLVSKEENYHNSMQKEFENRSKTTANQLQLLSNSLNRIAIDLGSVVLPVIKDFAKAGVWIADKIATLNQEFPILGKVVTYAVVGFGAFAVASATLGYVFSFLAGGIAKARIAFILLGNAIRFNPIGLAITAIAAGAYLIWRNWDKLKGFFSSLWDEIKSIFANAWGDIKRVISFSPLGIIINNWSAITNFFANFWANLKSGFSNGVNFITNIFISPINTIQKLWNKLIGWINKKLEWIASIGSKIKHFFGFGDNKEKKLTLKPAVEKVKPIVTAAAVSTTIATAQPVNTLNPINAQSIQPVKFVSIPTTQSQNIKQYKGPDTIVYNFNFGDIKVESKDGKIANPEEFKEEIKKVIEEVNFENYQRSLSDVM